MKDLWFALTSSRILTGAQGLMIIGALYALWQEDYLSYPLSPLIYFIAYLVGASIFGVLGMAFGLYAWLENKHKPTAFLIPAGVTLVFCILRFISAVLYQQASR